MAVKSTTTGTATISSSNIDATIAMFLKLSNEKKLTTVMRAGLRKGARIALRAVVSAAPVMTGALAAGFRLRSFTRTAGNEKRLSVSVKQPTRAQLGLSADSKWYYPAHLEYGTKHIPEMRFIRDSVDSAEPEIRAAVNDHLLAWIRAEVAKKNG